MVIRVIRWKSCKDPIENRNLVETLNNGTFLFNVKRPDEITGTGHCLPGSDRIRGYVTSVKFWKKNQIIFDEITWTNIRLQITWTAKKWDKSTAWKFCQSDYDWKSYLNFISPKSDDSRKINPQLKMNCLFTFLIKRVQYWASGRRLQKFRLENIPDLDSFSTFKSCNF